MTYLPPHFREDDPMRLKALVEAHPLAVVVAHADSGLQAHHIPLLLDDRHGEHGTLIGHVARNNTLWAEAADTEVLAIFQDADAYITPTWYPTKQETHEVVPTWNYAVVHAWGPLIVHDDERWTRRAVGQLTQAMERGNTPAWKMGDAPQAYLREMLAHIVGIEIPISRIVGKQKASQNRSEADRKGAIEGLRARSGPNDQDMAQIMAGDDTSEAP
jgi:transcriptional regulator